MRSELANRGVHRRIRNATDRRFRGRTPAGSAQKRINHETATDYWRLVRNSSFSNVGCACIAFLYKQPFRPGCRERQECNFVLPDADDGNARSAKRQETSGNQAKDVLEGAGLQFVLAAIIGVTRKPTPMLLNEFATRQRLHQHVQLSKTAKCKRSHPRMRDRRACADFLPRNSECPVTRIRSRNSAEMSTDSRP